MLFQPRAGTGCTSLSGEDTGLEGDEGQSPEPASACIPAEPAVGPAAIAFCLKASEGYFRNAIFSLVVPALGQGNRGEVPLRASHSSHSTPQIGRASCRERV